MDAAARARGKKRDLFDSLYGYSSLLPEGYKTAWLKVSTSGDSMLYVAPRDWREGSSCSRSLLLGVESSATPGEVDAGEVIAEVYKPQSHAASLGVFFGGFVTREAEAAGSFCHSSSSGFFAHIHKDQNYMKSKTADELSNHWFLSDLHLGHRNVIKYDGRPWDDIESHDKDITMGCRQRGASNRTLWLLGDIATRKEQLFPFLEEVKPVWGQVILIRGNHDDKVAWKYREMFTESHESRYLRVSREVRVYLSHYAHRVWRNSHHGAYHLYGHSHGHLSGIGRSMDVGAPCVGYVPISLAAVVEKLRIYDPTLHHPNRYE